MNLMIVPGILFCVSFLISVSMVIVSRRGSNLDEPLCLVLFNVCGAVTVEGCVLYPCSVGVFGMFAVM